MRGFLAMLGVLLAWSFWVSAQAPAQTNTPVPTPAPGVVSADKGRVGVWAPAGWGEDEFSFGLKDIELLREVKIFGEPLWKYLASLIYIGLAFVAAKLLDVCWGLVLRRWAARRGGKFDDQVVDLLRGPVKVVATVVLLELGLNLFVWPAWVARWFSTGLVMVLAWSLTYVALKVVDLALSVWRQRTADKKDEAFQRNLFPILRMVSRVFVVIVAIIVTAPILGVNITGLLASLSIGALAVGLAAQDTLANLFGAVAVLVDKPFHVGDLIQLESVEGVVENIGLRSTRVRSLDGHMVTIPNKTVANATIKNVARRSSIRTVMNFGIGYDCDRAKIEAAVAILKEVYGAHPNTQDVWVNLNRFGDSALNVQVIHWWNNVDGKAHLAGMEQMHLEVKQRFDAAGIPFAFPSQTLYVRQDSAWRMSGEAG